MWNLRSPWVTYLIVWASSQEPSWQNWPSYWGQFGLGFIWEISAWFPSWKKAKDSGDEFWHKIRETKQTLQNTKIITFAPIIALVTLKAGITAVKWDASDAKIQQTMQDDAIRATRDHLAFTPVTGLKWCSYGKISSPLTEIPVGKTTISETKPARPLI